MIHSGATRRSKETLRKHDKNHLIFGDRFHEIDMPDIVVKEILPYVDAIAVQPTSREFNFDFSDSVYEEYGKPIYIADHVSSFATAQNPVTMGQAAKDPESYGAYYRRYLTAALSRSFVPHAVRRGIQLRWGMRRMKYAKQDRASTVVEPHSLSRESLPIWKTSAQTQQKGTPLISRRFLWKMLLEDGNVCKPFLSKR